MRHTAIDKALVLMCSVFVRCLIDRWSWPVCDPPATNCAAVRVLVRSLSIRLFIAHPHVFSTTLLCCREQNLDDYDSDDYGSGPPRAKQQQPRTVYKPVAACSSHDDRGGSRRPSSEFGFG